MDRNIKLGLIIAAGIFIGLSAYAALQHYIVFKQIENMTTNMAKGLQESNKQSRKRMLASQQEQQLRQQAKIAEASRIKAKKKATGVREKPVMRQEYRYGEVF